MKRKMSVMLVLVFCVSMCLSSMSFAVSDQISSSMAGYNVAGQLSMGSDWASASTTSSAPGAYKYAAVDYCYEWGEFGNYHYESGEFSGSYYAGVQVNAGHTSPVSKGALGRHIVTYGAHSWDPQKVDPFPTQVGTWYGDLPD